MSVRDLKIYDINLTTTSFNPFMHTVVVQQQITTIELMKEQSKKQKKTKNKSIKISCMKGLNKRILDARQIE